MNAIVLPFFLFLGHTCLNREETIQKHINGPFFELTIVQTCATTFQSIIYSSFPNEGWTFTLCQQLRQEQSTGIFTGWLSRISLCVRVLQHILTPLQNYWLQVYVQCMTEWMAKGYLRRIVFGEHGSAVGFAGKGPFFPQLTLYHLQKLRIKFN